MRILVTGSAGFLGQWLVQDLQSCDHFVVGLDRRDDLISDEFIQHDLRTPLSPNLGRIDLCIHLASSVGGFLFNAGNREFITDEKQILPHLHRICARSLCDRVIFTSSINVFENSGVGPEGPLTTMNQTTPYARGKAWAENFIAQEFSSFSIVRPTNFFGVDQPLSSQRMGESHVIPDLLQKILNDPIVNVFGDGTQMRNFIHLSDVSQFILKLLKAQEVPYAHLRSEIFLSISDLVDILQNMTGHNKPIRFLPDYLKYEPARITAFDLPAAKQLGWAPSIRSLQEGLRFARKITHPTATKPNAIHNPKREEVVSAV